MEVGRVGFVAPTITQPVRAAASYAPQMYIAMSKTMDLRSPACFHQWDTLGVVSRDFKSQSRSVRRGALPQRRTDFGVCLASSRIYDEVNGAGFKSLKCPEFSCHAKNSSFPVCKAKKNSDRESPVDTDSGEVETMSPAQLACWVVSAIYVGWLFILPFAPGDPVWAISPSTFQMLIDLSLNFFFVLPLTAYPADFGIWVLAVLGRTVGIHGLAPVLHPMDEALFNFVIGWTLLFGPLLFSDTKRDRFGGSLEGLWLIQMLLTNTVLGPYMAIRLNQAKASPTESSRENRLKSISEGLTRGAKYVGLVGAAVGLVSLVWALYGRPEGGFGGIEERWDHLLQYISRERLAYAFLWDICLYTIFQPWLIGDNLSNVREEKREAVQALRFVPYVGLVAYVLGLRQEVKKV